jgi:O-antigen/teichoic acid export membrane protein/Ser/Thr protein kinase RdoA (MazF antagonist)
MLQMLTYHYRRLLRQFREDSLFKNAVYLMSSTVIMSLLGFLFWVFLAHLYAPGQIGQASALIAVTTLLSTLSLLGLNAGLLRFLPTSKQQSNDFNAATLVVTGTTLVAATIYVLFGNQLSGNFSLLAGSWHKLAFVFFMVLVSLNMLTDTVFIANRKAQYHTLCYTSMGSTKLLLPLVLTRYGSLGIFMAYMWSVIISLSVSYYLMWRRCGYHFLARPNWRLIHRTRAYATHNYIGGVLSGLPAQILPLLIIRKLGAAQVAYFSMAWTMANLLYVIPSASTQSLLAESSHAPHEQAQHVRRTLLLLAKLLIPVVIGAVLVAPFLLHIFGPAYAKNGTVIFQLLAISTFFVAGNYIGTTLLNLEKRTAGIMGVQIVSVLVTFIAAWLLMPEGLTGIGLAMLSGNITSTLCHLYLYRRYHHRSTALSNKPSGLWPWLAANWSDIESRRLLWPYAIENATFQPLHNGSHNATLLVKAGERRFVARFYKPNSKTLSHIERENEYVAYLAQVGQPVPAVLANQAGQSVSRTMFQGRTVYYIVMKYAYGKHPACYDEALINEMAELQGRLHQIGLAAQNITSTPLVTTNQQWRSHLIAPFVPQALSHFDFDISNILVSKGRINCVVDFEGFRYGPLLACLFHTLQHIYYETGSTFDLSQYLFVYQSQRRLTRAERYLLRLALVVRFHDLKILRWALTPRAMMPATSQLLASK